MAFESLEVRAAMLLQEIENGPEDLHEAWERLEQTLNAMRAEGMTPPEDLLRLEAELAEEFGRAKS